MQVLIHDLDEQEFTALYPQISEEVKIISDNVEIQKCIGCFGCWVKIPGTCVIRDHYSGMGKLLSQCDELIIISKCYYGGFSPFVKNVLDRSISYILPYFTIRNREMHHKSRYQKQFKLSAYIYGEDITQKEKDTMEKLVIANGINLNIKEQSVEFCRDIAELPNIRGSI